MTIKFNVPGKKRKELALTIAKWLGSEVKYQGAPTFAYEVDCFTIDKDGNLCGDNLIADEAVERLLEYLYDEGFESDISATEEPKESKLAISMPANKVALGTILQLLDAKGNLFKKALGVTELPIYNDEVKITFAWFPYTEDPAEVKAYDLFISKLCGFARNAKTHSAVFFSALVSLGMNPQPLGKFFSAILKVLPPSKAVTERRMRNVWNQRSHPCKA